MSFQADVNALLLARFAQSPPEFLFTTTNFSYVTVSTADGAPRRVNGRMAASNQSGLGIKPKMSLLGQPLVTI